MSTRSTINPQIPLLKPIFNLNDSPSESPELKAIIDKLNLQPHVEGGYFAETDRASHRVPNPFLSKAELASSTSDQTRSSSTSIYYLLTPLAPLGAFHRNRGRTVHTLHRGRGRYVIIHADEVASSSCAGGYGGLKSLQEEQRWSNKARVETFVVGRDVLKGERLQWIVEGGKYKCSFLLPDEEGGSSSEGLLISETVVPGFEYADHDFMRAERLEALVGEEQRREMEWMLRKSDC